jgi:site-specific DNA-methyltransferase (adenine-specific)
MIIEGDCLEEMRKMEDNSISCIVTDPPYGLGFMGKEWDCGLPHSDIWAEALRVVKPGGFLLSFGGTRTYHRLTCSIE